ncbi:MAG: hypothetical protein NVS3B20_03360 [Polyangiales bacterium]
MAVTSFTSTKLPIASLLLVDDHPANLLALEGILEPLNQIIVKASSGEEALKRLMNQEFAVILMDVQMPGIDGIQTAKLIKDRPKTRHIPIIFLTAISKDPSWVFKGYAQGAVDYLLKPFDPDILRSKVSVFVDLWVKGERLKEHEALQRAQERREFERESEVRYRNLIDAMAQSVWAARPDGEIYLVNKFMQEFAGVAATTLTSSDFVKLSHPDDQAKLSEHWSSSIATGKRFELEYRCRRASDGTYRWFLGRAVPELDDTGKILGWIGTATDIDDQKRDREDLAHFQSTLDATLDCVLILDAKTFAIRYANQGAVQQLGYSGSELLALSPISVEPEFTEDAMEGVLTPLSQGRASSHTYRTTHLRKDGSTIPVEVVAQYIAPPGADPRYVMVARDISERVRVESALRRANEAKDAFIAAASHELRTPLAAAKAQAQLALRRLSKEGDERTSRALTIIGSQIDRMAKLVEDLLDVSRLQSGRLSLEVTHFSFVELLQEVRERVQSLTENHDIQLRVAQDVRMTGDRGRLDQVITNLLANAIRYSPKGGPITVSCEEEGGALNLAVIDRGVGIPKEKQQLIFERFGRAHGSKYGGLGLGLTISQGIVEQHGGTITVESSGEPGEGTTFRVRMPIIAIEPRLSQV